MVILCAAHNPPRCSCAAALSLFAAAALPLLLRLLVLQLLLLLWPGGLLGPQQAAQPRERGRVRGLSLIHI